MSGGLGLIPAAVLVFAVAALLMSLLGGALYSPMRRFLRELPPAAEAELLLAFAVAPALTGLSLVVLALSPSLAHLIGIGIDHCHEHGHHIHFCLIHSDLWTGSATDWLILLLSGLAAATVAGDLPQRLWRAHGVARTLEAIALPTPAPESWRVVDMDSPLALTAGLIRPRIYLSKRLLDDLSPAELAAVVGHEQAHRRRRDALRQLVAEVLARLHPPPIRRRLLADLSLASERACDEEAALSGNGRLGVAGTILKVARLNAAHQRPSDALLQTLTGADLEARIQALLRPAPERQIPPWSLLISGAGVILAFGCLYSNRLHHNVESALHLLIS
jgi:Zn-dependent protease with chaperone function